MLQTLLIIHLLGACIWVGGHLAVATAILPQALKTGNIQPMLDFEQRFSILEMPSLILMIITGVWMSYLFGVRAQDWFHFANPVETAISIKVILLLLTLAAALSANIFVVPKAKKGNPPLRLLAVHVFTIVGLGILLVFFGSFVGHGGI